MSMVYFTHHQTDEPNNNKLISNSHIDLIRFLTLHVPLRRAVPTEKWILIKQSRELFILMEPETREKRYASPMWRHGEGCAAKSKQRSGSAALVTLAAAAGGRKHSSVTFGTFKSALAFYLRATCGRGRWFLQRCWRHCGRRGGRKPRGRSETCRTTPAQTDWCVTVHTI